MDTSLRIYAILLIYLIGIKLCLCVITPQINPVTGEANQQVTISWTYNNPDIVANIEYKTSGGNYASVALGTVSALSITPAGTNTFGINRLLVNGSGGNTIRVTLTPLTCAEDGGTFKLTLTPSLDINETTLKVQVLPNNPVTPSGPSGSFEAGQKVAFKCKANLGNPEGTIEWSRKVSGGSQFLPISPANVTVTKSPNTQYTCSNDGTGTLNRTLDKSDNGATYQCQVKPGSGLTVADPPKNVFTALDVKYGVTVSNITSSSGSSAIVGSKSVTLTCNADGNPMPTAYSWYKDDDQLSSTGSTHIIQTFQKSDVGVYKCNASNSLPSAGSNEATYPLAISDPTTTQVTTTTMSTTSKSPASPKQLNDSGSNDNSSGVDTALVGGLAGGGVALLIIIAGVVYYFHGRKKKTEDSGLASGSMNNHENAYDIDLEDQKPDKKPDVIQSNDEYAVVNKQPDPRKKNVEGLVYADLALDNRPRSRQPIQASEMEGTTYAEIRRP